VPDAMDGTSSNTPQPADAHLPRLRIAFVTDRFGQRFGGAEAYGVALMQELARQHDITVVAHVYDPQSPVQLPWIKLYVPAWLPSWVRSAWFAVCAHRATRRGFDLVHSHVNGWCAHVDVMHVMPVRFRWRVQPLPRFKRWLSRLSLRVQTYLLLEALRVRQRPGHTTVTVSTLTAKQLRLAYGTSGQFPVITPGVATCAPEAPSWRVTLRRKLGLQATDLLCLMVARAPLRKGLATVVQALQPLPHNVHLVVVGGDDATRTWFKQSPHATALRARVHLLDAVSDVRPYYAAADCCLHPTLGDSFGMVPLEAMAYGLPVILSPMPWCGFAQYVRHDDQVLLLDHPENAPQLANFVQQLRTQPALRARLGARARHYAEQHGWKQVAHAYQQVYTQVLAERDA